MQKEAACEMVVPKIAGLFTFVPYLYFGIADLARSYLGDEGIWLPHASHAGMALSAVFAAFHAWWVLGHLHAVVVLMMLVWGIASGFEATGVFGQFTFSDALLFQQSTNNRTISKISSADFSSWSSSFSSSSFLSFFNNNEFLPPGLILLLYWMMAWQAYIVGQTILFLTANTLSSAAATKLRRKENEKKKGREKQNSSSWFPVGSFFAALLMATSNAAADPCYSTYASGLLPSNISLWESAMQGITMQAPLPSMPQLYQWGPPCHGPPEEEEGKNPQNFLLSIFSKKIFGIDVKSSSSLCFLGVPMTNFFGWLLVALCIFICWEKFLLFQLRRRPRITTLLQCSRNEKEKEKEKGEEKIHTSAGEAIILRLCVCANSREVCTTTTSSTRHSRILNLLVLLLCPLSQLCQGLFFLFHFHTHFMNRLVVMVLMILPASVALFRVYSISRA